MSEMASKIPSVSIVYSTVCSGADQRKHQSSVSLVFVRGIHLWPVNSPHKGPVTRKMFPFDDVIIRCVLCPPDKVIMMSFVRQKWWLQNRPNIDRRETCDHMILKRKSFWWHFRHWLKWRRRVQSASKILSKWQHFPLNAPFPEHFVVLYSCYSSPRPWLQVFPVPWPSSRLWLTAPLTLCPGHWCGGAAGPWNTGTLTITHRVRRGSFWGKNTNSTGPLSTIIWATILVQYL